MSYLVRRLFVVLIISLFWPQYQAAALSDLDKTSVLEAVRHHLTVDYVDPIIGADAAQKLSELYADGAFDADATGPAFADHLSARLQAITGDGHLNVEYSETPLTREDDQDDGFAATELEKYYGAHLNFGVQSASRIEENIGLLDLRVFAPVDMGGETVTAALNMLAHTDALIIDLRKNGGGMADMADLVASYVFGSERQPLTGTYDRPSDTLTQRFTQAYVPGDRFGADKPVYILISSRTFSAAEALAYNLQALGRATIVGEPSGGGAHPFEYLPIDDHFVLWSVTAKSVNPITGGNWQGVGVQPDISVPAEKSLQTAIARIKTDLNERASVP